MKIFFTINGRYEFKKKKEKNTQCTTTQCSYMAVNDFTINFRHDDSQTQHGSHHTASLDRSCCQNGVQEFGLQSVSAFQYLGTR